jgi:5'-nucleotidase
MKILVTNDDGVTSAGLTELLKELKRIGTVTAIAPHCERSAIGHAVTFFSPLRMQLITKEKGCSIFSCDGTPTDCILLGLNHLLKEKPDIIITGINLGANIGDDITYSGTVTSAMEGALRGIPSMAVSIATFEKPLFYTAAQVAAWIARCMVSEGIAPRTFLNVNVPNVKPGDLEGIEITCQGESTYIQKFIKRKDPRGRDYFWLDHSRPTGKEAEGTDFYALSRNHVSVTPLKLDLTCHKSRASLKKWNLNDVLGELKRQGRA